MPGRHHTRIIHTCMVASTKLARVLALWEISPLSAIWWAVRPNKPPRSLLCGVPSLAKTQADISSVLHDFENRYTYGEIVRDQESSFREGELMVETKHVTRSDSEPFHEFDPWLLKIHELLFYYWRVSRCNTMNSKRNLLLMSKNKMALLINKKAEIHALKIEIVDRRMKFNQ